MIQIRITDIPAQGLEITDILSLELLNARMEEAPNNDIHFIIGPSFKMAVEVTHGGFILSGEVSTSYRQPCGRCLGQLEHPLDQKISLTLKPKSSKPGADRTTSTEEWQDDVGIVYFDGEHIDLEEILQESLILSLTPFNSKHENCPGVQQLEESNDGEEKETALGRALRDALVQ